MVMFEHLDFTHPSYRFVFCLSFLLVASILPALSLVLPGGQRHPDSDLLLPLFQSFRFHLPTQSLKLRFGGTRSLFPVSFFLLILSKLSLSILQDDSFSFIMLIFYLFAYLSPFLPNSFETSLCFFIFTEHLAPGASEKVNFPKVVILGTLPLIYFQC